VWVERFRAEEAPAAEVDLSDAESFEAFFHRLHARLFGALCIAVGDRVEADASAREEQARQSINYSS
jgi:hypothetical protein